ncbi:unnamed protein product, partial [Ectocarpus sp. 12 AP-2014]
MHTLARRCWWRRTVARYTRSSIPTARISTVGQWRKGISATAFEGWPCTQPTRTNLPVQEQTARFGFGTENTGKWLRCASSTLP